MKRLISILLAMILLFAAGTALADDWYCPECGAKNSGNFCPNDGTKRPEGSGSVSSSGSNLKVDNVKLETDGSVTVSWSGGSAPYKVDYQYYVNANHNSGADVIWWNASKGLNGNKENYKYDFVPGERYWVTVSDANGNQAWYDYSEYVGAVTRMSCPYHFTLRTHRKNKGSKVDYFSARDIMNEYGYHIFGATIKITPKISQDMTVNFRMGIKLPSGEPLLIHVENGTIHPGRGSSYYLWENYNFNYLWSKLMETKGEIPTGTYTYTLFIDNERLFNQNFNVN